MFILLYFYFMGAGKEFRVVFPVTERRIPAERGETYVMDLLCERL